MRRGFRRCRQLEQASLSGREAGGPRVERGRCVARRLTDFACSSCRAIRTSIRLSIRMHIGIVRVGGSGAGGGDIGPSVVLPALLLCFLLLLSVVLALLLYSRLSPSLCPGYGLLRCVGLLRGSRVRGGRRRAASARHKNGGGPFEVHENEADDRRGLVNGLLT